MHESVEISWAWAWACSRTGDISFWAWTLKMNHRVLGLLFGSAEIVNVSLICRMFLGNRIKQYDHQDSRFEHSMIQDRFRCCSFFVRLFVDSGRAARTPLVWYTNDWHRKETQIVRILSRLSWHHNNNNN